MDGGESVSVRQMENRRKEGDRLMHRHCKGRSIFVATGALVGGLTLPAHGTRYFVKGTTGADSNLGTTWGQAVKTLQRGIELAKADPSPTDEIWVTASTYRPDEGPGPINSNDPDAYYDMVPNIAIYGGFVGGEANLTDRNFVTNVTILSGDIDVNDAHNPATSPDDINGTNSYHVLRFIQGNAADNPTAIVDGFTITAGSASQVHTPDLPPIDDDEWISLGGGANLDGGCV